MQRWAVHSLDDKESFSTHPPRKKKSLKDVVRLSTPTSFGVRNISEHTLPDVLRIRQMRLQLEKMKDGVLFLK